ncbi:penicillin-binding protein 2 [Candidatus Woesebacteria bacterium]|nr:penicillin-binding protein 2 [Candidatus Woesebacteria bacterium]
MPSILSRSHTPTETFYKNRERIFLSLFSLGIVIILARLFYWQIIEGSRLTAQANNQYERKFTSTGVRGSIYTADGQLLVGNKKVYRLFAQPQVITQPPEQLAALIAPLAITDVLEYQTSSPSATRAEDTALLQETVRKKLENKDARWTSLISTITEETKQKITALQIHGIGFDQYEKRYYPEASMAAQITGFVGKDDQGEDIGYFGIEGALEQELKARSQKTTVFADALGLPLPTSEKNTELVLDGRDITLTIRRDLQNLAETKLRSGLERYGAASGEVIIMDPKTGDILAAAVLPTYDQKYFYQYPAKNYANPSLNALYEPGSTFKILTVAAGIDAGVISPDTACDHCSSARTFGKYTIKTWNDEYHPGITMTEALAKSDNTAMIFVAEKLGIEKHREYIEKFGIGEPIHIELQGDRKTPFPNKWGPVEQATISFGQGISTTSLQMMRAISTIANGGIMMRPRIIASVTEPSSGKVITQEPHIERQVISAQSAATVAKMMIESAGHGEAQWTASRTHWIAGKTGTSQVPDEHGGYKPDKTIASFIGFAPPENPKFVMIVKLSEPTSSIWAAETAAPLWYGIAKDLFLLLNMPPDRYPDQETTKTTKAVGD